MLTGMHSSVILRGQSHIHLFTPICCKLTNDSDSHIITSKADVKVGCLNFV